MFLHYITVMNILNIIDLYYTIPLEDAEMLSLYLIVSGIFLFIILYLYVNHNKKDTNQDN